MILKAAKAEHGQHGKPDLIVLPVITHFVYGKTDAADT